jgi:hypothetical protein
MHSARYDLLVPQATSTRQCRRCRNAFLSVDLSIKLVSGFTLEVVAQHLASVHRESGVFSVGFPFESLFRNIIQIHRE